MKAWDLARQVDEQKNINQKTQARNTVLDAEVRDLKQGTEALEERARNELGMVKRDEIFFQIVGDHSLLPTSTGSDVRATSGVFLK